MVARWQQTWRRWQIWWRHWFVSKGESRSWQTWSQVNPTNPVPENWELLQGYVDTAYYCANLNARAVAAVPLRLYALTASGQPVPRAVTRQLSRRQRQLLQSRQRHSRWSAAERIDEVLEHPLLDLLQAPNRAAGELALSGFELIELTQLYLELVGKVYWYLESDGLRVPRSLWLIPPQQLRPRPSTSTAPPPHRHRPLPGAEPALNSGGWVESTIYEYLGSQPPRELPGWDLIHFRLPDPRDPYRQVLSPLAAAFTRQRMTQKYLRQAEAMLDNRARPDLLISPSHPEGIIGDSEAKRLERAFLDQFRGNGGGIFISRDSLRIEPLNYSPRDLSELSEHQMHVAQVARAFDIPLALLDKDATHASAAQGRAQHAKNAVQPRVRRLVDRLNACLVPQFEPSGRLLLMEDDPVAEDVELKLRVRESNLQLGLTTINEERFLEGWEPVPWGDQPYLVKTTPAEPHRPHH